MFGYKPIQIKQPKLLLSNVTSRTGPIASVTFCNVYHVFSPLHKSTGSVYGLETAVTSKSTQAVYRSDDGGISWTKLGDISVDTPNGERLQQIYVEPRSETLVILKCNNIGATPLTYSVNTYDNTCALLGSLDIGEKYWHAATHNVDGTVLNGTYNNVIMFAEYGNSSATKLNVWKTTNRGVTWTSVFEQTGNGGTGEIKHFHTLQVDPFTNDWWLSSGDSDAQCKIWRSQNDGATWELLFSGSQNERTLSFVFESDYVYYAMDSPDEGVPSYIFRINKTTMDKEVVARVYNNLAVYGLTKTFYPHGFLVWLVCEPYSKQSNKYKVQFYSYKDNKLHDVAEIDSTEFTPGYGILEASRYQSLQDGRFFISATGAIAKPGWPSTNISYILKGLLTI